MKYIVDTQIWLKQIIKFMNSILLYLCYSLLVFLAWKLYQKVMKPYHLYKFYQNQFKGKGHKVFFMRFLPFFSSIILEFNRDTKQKKDSYWSMKKHGKDFDLSVANFGCDIILTINKPDLIKQLYNLDGGPTYIKQEEIIHNIKRISGVSITMSHGEVWKSKRKMMTSFLNFNYVNQQFQTISTMFSKKLNSNANGRDEFELYLQELTEQMTGSVILEIFFGGGLTNVDNLEIEGQRVSIYMRKLMEDLTAQSLDPLTIMLGADFPQYNLRPSDREVTRKVKLFKEFTTNFVKDRIYEIKEGKSRKQDYIEKVFNSVSEKDRGQEFINDLVADFSTLYIAGTDTTSHSAMMVVYFIIMFPEVKQKLNEEIEKFIKNDEDVRYEIVKEMKYLDCVIHQSTRYYQPANGILFREATVDHYLADIKIKKGTILFTSSFGNHYNPQNFENPFDFQPSRWLKEDGSFNAPRPYTWLTFSAGPRSCIGKQLAFMEMKLIVITLLRKYEMEMETQDLTMYLQNFSYQPQKLMTKFTRKKLRGRQ